MSTKIKENIPNHYQINAKKLLFEKPLVMAIVNLTPDSFYDGGKYSDVNDVLRDAEEKIKHNTTTIKRHIITLLENQKSRSLPQVMCKLSNFSVTEAAR